MTSAGVLTIFMCLLVNKGKIDTGELFLLSGKNDTSVEW